MNENGENVRQLHATSSQQSAHGGGGHGNELHGRVSAIEAHMQHLATKNDVTSLKVWILGGVLSTIVIASAIAATVVKAFF